MNLELGIILDELAMFNPVTIKAVSIKTQFQNVHIFSSTASDFESVTDHSTLFLVKAELLMQEHLPLPANILVIGKIEAGISLEKLDTLISVTGVTDQERVFQKLFDIFSSYQQWDQRMLTAIIEQVNIDDFLNIAIEKLTNPIALFDNGLTLIASAGSFEKSPTGTIWEKIDLPGYPLPDLFTLQEQIELASKSMKYKDDPYLHIPSFDQNHTYASTCIRVDGKLCGNIGLVDINASFTPGQLMIVQHITERLTQYFKTNEIYMRIAEIKTDLIKHLLEDSKIIKKNVLYHLERNGWKLNDEFYLLTFVTPIEDLSIVESKTYLKRLYNHYPGSMSTVYKNQLIVLIRKSDYAIEDEAEKHRLMNLLSKYEMKCGISQCFHDFLELKLYYIQSHYAVENCIQNNADAYCFYAPYMTNHLLSCLEHAVDLRVFSYPEVLEIQKTGDELERDLLHCLYVYLVHGRNLSSAAKALNLHRNTLIYRIEKIARLLKMDFNKMNENELFSLMFSCIVAERLKQKTLLISAPKK